MSDFVIWLAETIAGGLTGVVIFVVFILLMDLLP